MNFLGAVKAMKEGKIITREAWGCKGIWSDPHNLIRYVEDDHTVGFTPMDIEGTDWEIVDEKKTLSDHMSLHDNYDGKFLPVCYVLEHIKEFMYWVTNEHAADKSSTIVFSKAVEIFGKELLK